MKREKHLGVPQQRGGGEINNGNRSSPGRRPHSPSGGDRGRRGGHRHSRKPMKMRPNEKIQHVEQIPPPTSVTTVLNPFKKEDIMKHVARWEEGFSSPTFQAEIRGLVVDQYPCEHKSLLDHILASFLLFHPEHITFLVSPILELLATKKIVYSKRQAPFYAFLSSFNLTEPNQINPNTQAFVKEMLRFLSEKQREDMVMTPYLVDSLLELPVSLRDAYFRDDLQAESHTKMTSLLSSTSHHSSPPRHSHTQRVIALVEEEKRRYLTFFLSHHCVTSLLTSDIDDLTPYAELFKIYFSQPPSDMVWTFIHDLILSHSQKTWKLMALVQNKLPYPNDWFFLHFLHPVLRTIEEENQQGEDFLMRVLSHRTYSFFFFKEVDEDQDDSEKKAPAKNSKKSLISVLKEFDKRTQRKVLYIWQKCWHMMNDNPDRMQTEWNRLHGFLSLYSTVFQEIQPVLNTLFTSFLDVLPSPSMTEITQKIITFFFMEQRTEIGQLFHLFLQFIRSANTTKRAEMEELIIQSFQSLAIFETPQASPLFIIPSPFNFLSAETSNGKFAAQLIMDAIKHAAKLQNDQLSHVFRLLVRSSKSLIKLLGSRDPETRIMILDLLLLLHSSLEKLPESYSEDDFDILLGVINDTFQQVLDKGRQVLSTVIELSPADNASVLGSHFFHHLQSAKSPTSAHHLIVLLEEFVTKFPSQSTQILSMVDTQLFTHIIGDDAAFAIVDRLSAFKSVPNPNFLSLLEKLMKIDGIDISLMKQIVRKSTDGLSQFPAEIQLHQLKLLASMLCSQHAPQLLELIHERTAALISLLSASSRTVRELSLTVLNLYVGKKGDNDTKDMISNTLKLKLSSLSHHDPDLAIFISKALQSLNQQSSMWSSRTY